VTSNDIEWKISPSLVPYPEAMEAMEARVAAIQAGTASEMVWLLEHPPLYTSGTSAKESDLLQSPFPIYEAGRGGQFTYHGPGQRIGYVMLDLKKRSKQDVRAYVASLERWIIAALGELGVECFVREGRIGVWTNDPVRGEAKIAALGIRIKSWVTFHGISINVSPELSHYAGIVPCGIREFGVTSLQALGNKAGMSQLDAALKEHFAIVTN